MEKSINDPIDKIMKKYFSTYMVVGFTNDGKAYEKVEGNPYMLVGACEMIQRKMVLRYLNSSAENKDKAKK